MHTNQAVEPNATDALSACTLCPRACGANRAAEERGYCQAGLLPRVFRYGAHFGEEPPITGERGSGAVFFSHCTLRCIYCQNHPWSQGGQGEELTIGQLSAIFEYLHDTGCHNWNLITPTPWLPQIKEAVSPLIRAGKILPFVYNTSGFESKKSLELHHDLIDIALVDLRYATSASAQEGSDAVSYVDKARAAVKWFWEHLGALQLDERGIAIRGVICRILALPGRIDESIASLQWIHDNMGNEVHISVMSQYTPVHHALEREGWDARVTQRDYEKLTDAAAALGFENGWIQEFDSETPADLLGQEMPAGEGIVGVVRTTGK
ncbi:MAG: radical SAM protein [Kiritimatiellae bacterium]|nr:radical SAM protein [Kiritimatiellia bacterium]